MKGKQLRWTANFLMTAVVIYGFIFIPSYTCASETGTVWTAEGYAIKKMASDGTLLLELRSFSPASIGIHSEDNSIWVINSAERDEGKLGQVLKFGTDGKEVFRLNEFEDPTAISVNTNDGSCWVADRHSNFSSAVAKVSKEGKLLFKADGFSEIDSLAVNSKDGTLWVADRAENASDQIVKLSSDGTELFRVSGFKYITSISLDTDDGSIWVSDGFFEKSEDGKVVKLSSSGEEIFRVKKIVRPEKIAVNSTDGSCWISSNNRIFKVSRSGELLYQSKEFTQIGLLSVNPLNGEVWATEIKNENSHRLVRLSSKGEVLTKGKKLPMSGRMISALAVSHSNGDLWISDGKLGELVKIGGNDDPAVIKGLGRFRVTEVVINPTDSSCWLLNWYREVIRLDSDGREMARVEIFDGTSEWGESMAVDPSDGSLWITASYKKKVVKISSDGKKIVEAGGFDFPYSLAVDPFDGSCWVGDYYQGKIMKLDAEGREIFRRNSFNFPIVSVNTKDGSCWVADNGQIFRFDSNGNELMRAVGDYSPSSISVDSSDNSCWVMYTPIPASPVLVKYRIDGSKNVVNEKMAHAYSLSVNPHDNSCWLANGEKGFKKIAGHGRELFSLPLPDRSHSFGVSVHPGIRADWLPRIFQNGKKGWMVIKGSKCAMHGLVHSHGGILIKGTKNTLDGKLSAVKSISIKGPENDFSNVKTDAYVHSMASFHLNDYQKNADYIHEGIWHVKKDETVADGIHFVKGDVLMEKSDISQLLTIVATGSIKIIGENNHFTAADNEMKILFFCGKNIEIHGKSNIYTGIVYAPYGWVRMKGPLQTLKGSLIADRVSIIGNKNTFQPYELKDFESAILNNRNDIM